MYNKRMQEVWKEKRKKDREEREKRSRGKRRRRSGEEEKKKIVIKKKKSGGDWETNTSCDQTTIILSTWKILIPGRVIEEA